MDLKEDKTYIRQHRYNPNGQSYKMRVEAINRIYEEHAKDGVSNAHIWRKFIFPIFGISIRTFYNYMKKGL